MFALDLPPQVFSHLSHISSILVTEDGKELLVSLRSNKKEILVELHFASRQLLVRLQVGWHLSIWAPKNNELLFRHCLHRPWRHHGP